MYARPFFVIRMRGIAIDCLNCGHTATMAEEDLENFGYKPDTSLAIVTKRLVCSKCNSKAVRAYRYLDDELQPLFPLAPSS
jgi:hypothetical protein